MWLSTEGEAVATAYLQNANADGPSVCMVRNSGPAVASVMLSRDTVSAEPTVMTGESSYSLVAIASNKANHCQVKQGQMDLFASEGGCLSQCFTNQYSKQQLKQKK